MPATAAKTIQRRVEVFGLLPVGEEQDDQSHRDALPVDGLQQVMGLAPGGGVPEGDDYYAPTGSGDQAGGGGTQAVEEAVHIAIVTEAMKQDGYQNDDDDGGRHQAQGGDDTTERSPSGEAYIGGHVHPHGARSGFRDGDHVGQLLAGKPAGAGAHIL